LAAVSAEELAKAADSEVEVSVGLDRRVLVVERAEVGGVMVAGRVVATAMEMATVVGRVEAAGAMAMEAGEVAASRDTTARTTCSAPTAAPWRPPRAATASHARRASGTSPS